MAGVTQKLETVLYDDYFTDPNDPGVDVSIAHRGKLLTFRLKKSLTLAEKQIAANAGVSISIDGTGQPTLNKMDQSAYTREILIAGVKAWPFAYQDGTPVPITRDTISRMDGELAEKISFVLLGQREAQAQALVPFGKKSDAA